MSDQSLLKKQIFQAQGKDKVKNNGALNILARRYRVLACEESGVSQIYKTGTWFVYKSKLPNLVFN